MSKITLYRLNSIGIGEWSIWAEPPYLYYSHAVVVGGAEQIRRDHIQTNQSGRTLQQQIDLEMRSRVQRAMDRGYKSTREEAAQGSTNQLALPNPMLAQKLIDVRMDLGPLIRHSNVYMQPKLDGHRCLITRTDGELVAYSRRGKQISTIAHVLGELDWLSEGMTLDGELYKHGPKLQELSSLIKREQDGSAGLEFCWYDVIDPRPYPERQETIVNLARQYSMKSVVPVDTFQLTSIEHMWELFHKFRKAGFEGGMVRLPTAGYQPNLRSSQLLKVKEREDCEVKVMGAWPARDGSAILHVKMDSKVEFNVLAPGSIDEKRSVMDNIESYVGRKLTIEYAHLTKDGVPFHAVATRWHEEI